MFEFLLLSFVKLSSYKKFESIFFCYQNRKFEEIFFVVFKNFADNCFLALD